MNKIDIDKLVIKWDLDNCNFNKLKTPCVFKTKPIIKNCLLENLNNSELYPDFIKNQDDRIIDLINFVKCGNDIIPPQVVKIPKMFIKTEYFGFHLVGFTKKGFDVLDGCHRINLAKNLGLIEIPCLVYDFNDEFKWKIPSWVIRNGLTPF